MKKVSILVPVYNAATYLNRCVQSLMAQSYDNIGFIFVDDGSTDGSLELLENYGRNDKHFTILRHEANRGIAATRNTLLDHATGEYLLFVDSDDYIAPDAVESLVAIAEGEEADIVKQSYYEVRGEVVTASLGFAGDRRGSPLHSLIAGSDGVDAMWLLLIRRSVVEQHGLRFPKDINVCEDWLMSIKLYYYANKVVTTSGAYYYYERGNASSLTSRRRYASDEGLKAIEHIYSFLVGEGIYETYREAFLARAFKWKQALLISGDLFDVERYVAFFPESNSYWRRLGLNYGLRERLLFTLAEWRITWLIKLLHCL